MSLQMSHLYTDFKLPYCAFKFNRGTKEKMKGKERTKEQSKQDSCEVFGHATHDALRGISSRLMTCETW
jgi:hypothetical protein